jgi:hypothetical protein
MNVRNVLPKDAIPSIDDPEFGRDYFGEPADEVVVLEAEPPRAYPFRILGYHEIVNDVLPPDESGNTTGTGRGAEDDGGLEGVPVAVTWCPICWSSVVYDRRVDGRTLTFGTSGKLADDALVMYDRETDSEWKQPSGTAIAGELVGRELDAIPAPILTWEKFQASYPDGVVLQPDWGSEPEGSPAEFYELAPYERYLADEAFGLPAMRGVGEPRSWNRTDVEPKTLVLGIVDGDDAVGYPIERVDRAGGVVTDSVGSLDVVVVLAGHTLEAYRDPGSEYELEADRLRADGTTWDPHTGASADGRRLERVPARRMLAFAWQDDHGPGSFFDP